MAIKIRKTATFTETQLIEGGKVAATPLKLIAAVAVIENPWGKDYVEDLRKTILAEAPTLGDLLVPMLHSLLDEGESIEAYGKAAIVGTDGEIEHASGFIHTLYFGNKFRDSVRGTSYLSFTNLRAGPGTTVQLPMMHINDVGLRSHYLTYAFNIIDAPAPNEILIAIGGATAGRPHHRIGNRYSDMEEMGITKNHSFDSDE